MKVYFDKIYRGNYEDLKKKLEKSLDNEKKEFIQ